jgi:hypothetical protein
VAIDLVRCGGLTDAFLHQAKQQLLAGEEAYADRLPELAALAPNIYEPLSLEEAFSGCCSRLLTTIGFMLMSEDRSSWPRQSNIPEDTSGQHTTRSL